ncbi:hypothetical protein N7495_000551 [Penicillium taxi]|uniref:uncharacterized protein n=1 Tax=Penicillium taxi TaxID=168475 RepID=UPI0025453764|nr:uncharacterized protein N7495_000551 [Penicillium taxi]KAJ5907869.1 hypothetical protein N7495_000551 [Penicillium taxi]
MSFTKYILPALAATQLAFAKSDDTCSTDTTISSQSDADAIASCSVFDGDLTIKKDFSGVLSLAGIEKITGALSCTGGTNVTSITAANLGSIGKAFTLSSLTQLSTLSFANLSSVGSISWEALPELLSLDFSTGVTEAGDVSIVNTGLTSLGGISLKTVGLFDIENNRGLKTVNINNLMNATDLINFSGNYDQLEIDLPNLGTGTNLTLRNISSVSVPSLEKLTGQLGFWGTDFKSFSAPNLTATGDIVFMDNAKLTNISLPVLKTINGGFSISRNDKLDTISTPKLETVTGAIDFTGTFNTVDLGSLERVAGGFNLQSTEGKFECSTFKTLQSEGVIKGTYSCKATTNNPTTSSGKSGTSSSTTSSSTAAASTSTGAASINGVAVPVAGVAAAFYAFAQLL